MNTKQRKVFETDRKMELRLRLALKRVDDAVRYSSPELPADVPERETLVRLIDRVRQL